MKTMNAVPAQQNELPVDIKKQRDLPLELTHFIGGILTGLRSKNVAPGLTEAQLATPVELPKATHAQQLSKFMNLGIQRILNGDIFGVVGGMITRRVSPEAKLNDQMASSQAVVNFVLNEQVIPGKKSILTGEQVTPDIRLPGLLECAESVPDSTVGDRRLSRLDEKWSGVGKLLSKNWLAYDLLQAMYASEAWNPRVAVEVFNGVEIIDDRPEEAARLVDKFYSQAFHRPASSRSEVAAMLILRAVAEHRLSNGARMSQDELGRASGYAKPPSRSHERVEPPTLGHVVSSVISGQVPPELPANRYLHSPQVLEPMGALAVADMAREASL